MRKLKEYSIMTWHTYIEMVTTASLVNIHHLIQIPKKEKIPFFLMMRTLGIYFLNNCQIYPTVVLTIITILCITSQVLELEVCTFCLTTFIWFSHSQPSHLCWPQIWSLFFLWIWVFWFVLFLVLDSRYKSANIVFVFLSQTHFT